MRVYLAADHAAYELKKELLTFVGQELGHEVEDCGAFENNPDDDYPSITAVAARKLSEDVEQGLDTRAIIAGGSGQGEAIAANRFRGVRCAVFYGKAGEQTDIRGKKLDIISSARAHNDANALSLGARFLTLDEAKSAVRMFLSTPFSEDERHRRRISQLDS